MTTENNLGGHPAWNMVKATIVFIAITAIVVGVAFLINNIFGSIVGLLAGGMCALASPVLLAKLVASFISARIYNDACRQVADGKLIPSYVGRGLECRGMAVVDETNKNLYINGRICGFADVKSINTGWEQKNKSQLHYVEIVLKNGTKPMKKVYFDNDQVTTTFYHRLSNSLGFA